MVWLVVFLMVASPLLAFALVRLVGLEGSLGDAVVIMATGCAATSSPAFARLVGLDPELSLVASLLSTLVIPLTAPPIALGLLGIAVPLTVAGLSARLGLVVGLPLLISLGVRQVAGPARLAPWGRAIDGAAVLLVALYGVGVMDGILARLVAEPWHVLGATALAFAGNYGLNLLTTLAFLPFGRRVALATGLLSGNRNMALYLAVMPAETGADMLMFFALCQFPLFLSPFLLKPLYLRLVPRP